MSKFIELCDKNGKRHYMNINYIEEVAECENGGCVIFFAFNCPNATEQDYIEVQKEYDEVVLMIRGKCK